MRSPLPNDAGAVGVLLVAVALLTGLVACTPGRGTPDPAASGGTTASAATAGATDPVPADAITFAAGGLSLSLQVLPGAGVGVESAEDGSARATLLRVTAATTPSSPAAQEETVTLARMVAPAGTTATVLSDGSATFADANGVLVGGLAAPSGPFGADYLPAPDGALEVVVPADTSEDVVVWLADAALLDAQWGDQEGGRSLAVTPTAWTRAGSLAAQELTWVQLVAREPEADAATMHDQLVCHMLGAPTKDTWNLEPWRPEVDLVTLVATKCNPTEPDAG